MELGKRQQLQVIRRTDFGIYLGTEKEQVLLPKKQIPEGTQIGDILEVFIYRDSMDRLIATTNTPLVMLGQTAVLTVKDVSKNGAYLDWGLEKDLFLPYKEQARKIVPGERVLIGVYIDKSNRLCATMKVYEYLTRNSTYEAEDIVTGTVYSFNPQFGYFVAVDNQFHGMIPKNEMSRNIKIGEQIEARVKNVRPDGKLELSLRKKAYLQIEEDAEKIYDFMLQNGGKIDYTDKANPEIIKKDFEMSKNEFKRAIGKLLKEKRITIGENNIFIKK